MALGWSAVDAVVGALATAFFGSLGVSFLLNHILQLREDVKTLRDRLDKLKTLEDATSLYGTRLVDARMLTPVLGRDRDGADLG